MDAVGIHIMGAKQLRGFLKLLFIVIFCSLHSFVMADDLHQQLEPLKSAGELNYPPFSVVEPDGTAGGFSVELLKAVVEAVDLEVNLAVGPWHEIKQQLQDGRLDVLPLVSYSPERDQVFDFTIPYLQMHGAIFVRAGETSIVGVEDLKDKEVLVMRDDTAHEYALRNKLTSKLILTTTFEEAMQLLSSGKHDAVFCQYVMGLQLIRQLGIKNVVSLATKRETSLRPRAGMVTGFQQKFCLAVPEGRKELLAHLNEGLAIVAANGTYDKLYHKWFGPILPSPPLSLQEFFKYFLLVCVPILFLLAAIGVFSLKREVARQTRRLQLEIQERKQAEEAIKKSERLLAETGRVGKVGGWEFNIDTKKLVWTNETYRIHEVDRSYAPTLRKGARFFPPASLPVMNRAVQRAVELGEPFDLELEIITGRGNLRFTHVVGKTDRKNNRVYGFIQDITARKQAEFAARESTDRFRTLFEKAPISYQSLDENGCFIEVNQTWLDVMGYTKDEIIGRFFGDFLHPDWRSHFVENFPRFRKIGEILGIEFVMIKKDGLSVLMSINGKIGKTSNGAFLQTHCVLHDITKVRQAEEEKAALEAQLHQSQKMEAIGTLAGGIAHDFNNILAAILGYADMALVDTPSSSPAKYPIEQVVKAGTRAKNLVKQILSFSRKEVHRVAPMKLHLVAREALNLLRASTPTTIQIRQNIDKKSGTIMADPTQIHQIMMNLCTNATQAMSEEEGTLTVSVTNVELDADKLTGEPQLGPGPYVHLSVTDSGVGIDREHLNRIFDPYFTTKGVGKGSGMGLAVVTGIVKSSGGMIAVESTLGKGTTFNVYFPRCAEQITEEVKKTGALPSGGEKILIVDDEESVADMTRIIVERLGYQATAITSSVKALALFRSRPEAFDLVISDQTMPEMTGEQLAGKLRAVRPDLPIILCTGYSSKIDHEKAENIDISAFLMKPVPMRELAETIRKVLDERVAVGAGAVL